MASWNDLKVNAPALEKLGHLLLIRAGRGYLATTRGDGGPRVHPICPVVHKGRLLGGIIKSSPKFADLIRDSRYMLHAPLGAGDSEFWVKGDACMLPPEDGEALLIAHPDWRMAVPNAFFEFTIKLACGTIFQAGENGVPVPDRRIFRPTAAEAILS